MMKSLALGLTLMCSAGAMADDAVDYFADGAFLLSTTSELGDMSASQSGNPGNILGGQRDIIIYISSGSGIVSSGTIGAATGAAATPATDGGAAGSLLFDTGAGTQGGIDIRYQNLGGIDLATAYTAFAVQVADIQGSVTVSAFAADTVGPLGVVSSAVTSAGTVTFDFASPGFAGVDFSDIDFIALQLLTSDPASDVNVSSFTLVSVPEPTTLAVLLASGSCLMLRRRRDA